MIPTKIKKILVPLDDSKNLLRALDMAIYLARKCEAILVGICVIYTSSRTEFGRGIAVEKGSYEKVKNSLILLKLGLLKTGLCLMGRYCMVI